MESPKVTGVGDNGSGDSVLEVCDSRTSEVEVRSVRMADQQDDLAEQFSIELTAKAAGADYVAISDDNDNKSSDVKFNDSEMSEVRSVHMSDQQVDLEEQFCIDQIATDAAAAAADDDDDDDDDGGGGDAKSNAVGSIALEFTGVSCDDVYNNALLISSSASSSLSSFTITPCSSVTVDDPTVDSSPYQRIALSASEPLSYGNDSCNILSVVSTESYVSSSSNVQDAISATSYVGSATSYVSPNSNVQDVISATSCVDSSSSVQDAASAVPCVGPSSNLHDAISSNTCSVQHRGPTDETMAAGSKAASVPAASHAVNALNSLQLSTQSTNSVVNRSCYSAPGVADDGCRSASEPVLPNEQSNEHGSNLISLLNSRDDDCDISSRQLHKIAEYRSVDGDISRPSHVPSLSAIACSFNCESPEVKCSAVDIDRRPHGSSDITESQSADCVSSLPDQISSERAVAPVAFGECTPMSPASESAAVTDSWSTERSGAAAKDRQTNDNPLSPVSAAIIADINTHVLPPGEPTVPLSVNLRSDDAVDVAATGSEQRLAGLGADRSDGNSDRTADTSQPNVAKNNLLALKQVSKTFKSSAHVHLM